MGDYEAHLKKQKCIHCNYDQAYLDMIIQGDKVLHDEYNFLCERHKDELIVQVFTEFTDWKRKNKCKVETKPQRLPERLREVDTKK